MSAVKQNKALDFMKDYALYFVLLLLLVVNVWQGFFLRRFGRA